jgi:hypothetical protein
MKTKQGFVVVVGIVTTVAGLTCAPVDPPVSTQRKLPAPEVLPDPGSSRVPQADALRKRLDAAIKQVRDRPLLTTNGFWTVFHGILGLGPSVQMVHPSTKQRFNALDYVASGKEVRGLRFIPTSDGLDVETRPGTFISQGHQDQFVAEMVQWGVSPDRKFIVGGKEYTFMDFVRFTKARASVKTPQELEWALLIIGQHYGTDIKWTNSAGEELRFEDLLRKEMAKPPLEVDGSQNPVACGGTHRLFGLSWVYHLHLRKGGKTTGVWKEVADYTTKYKKLAKKWQNMDGSFSTNFFRGRDLPPDPDHRRTMELRINTTGHIFEWLALALSDEELREPWVERAANALALMILDRQGSDVEGGSMYHAIHGVLIYYSRIYGPNTLDPPALAPPVPLLPAKKS